MIRHCLAAEWTPSLHQNILIFEIEAALTVSPDRIEDKGRHLECDNILLWVCFILRTKEHVGILTLSVHEY